MTSDAATAPEVAITDALTDGAVVGLLLAAGFGRRFDAGGRRNKLLASLPDGQTLITSSARALCSALDHVAVVVPSRGTLLEAAVSDLPVHLIRNPRAKEGMGASIAVGIAALRAQFPRARGWLIALADMPFVAPKSIRAIADAIGHGRNPIVAACYDGRRGHPVGFDRSMTDGLVGLEGDNGASVLIRLHGVDRIECDDPGVLRDIDTREDLSRDVRPSAVSWR